MRSLLLTSAKTERQFADAMASGADAVILDQAQAAVRVLANAAPVPNRPAVYVRIGPSAGGRLDAELDPIVPAEPDGVVLLGAEGGGDLMRLSAMLAAREAIAGLADGAIGIVAMITTAAGLLDGGSFRGATARLRGFGWDASAFAEAIGAEAARDTEGHLIEPCRTARSLCLIAAAAAAVPAFDTAYIEVGLALLEAECAQARQQGFAGKLAVHPDQVPIVNAVFARADAT